MIAIYTVIFSQVMKAKLGVDAGPFDFTIYLCAGLLPWTAFSEVVVRGTVAFQENAHFIKKISFPKEILQAVVSGSALLTLMISLGIYLILLIALGHPPGKALIFLPVALIAQIMLASGIGMFLSAMNVFFRDVQQVVNIMLQVWFWLTPIVYMEHLVPSQFRILLQFNPMYHVVGIYHRVFFTREFPEAELVWTAVTIGFVAFLVGCYTIWHFKDQIVDEL